MECTIGWVKVGKGYILFKNSDMPSRLKLKNELISQNEMFGIKYVGHPGCIIGVNKFCVGIAVAGANFDGMNKRKYLRMWPVVERTLKTAKTASEGKNIIIRLFCKQDARTGGNTIISDLNESFVIESTGKIAKFESGVNYLVRTNHFILLKKKYSLSEDVINKHSSFVRLGSATNFLKRKVKTPKDLYNILKSHKPHMGNDSICRHGSKIRTISSSIFHVKKDKILLNYIFNQNPCTQNYKILEIKFSI